MWVSAMQSIAAWLTSECFDYQVGGVWLLLINGLLRHDLHKGLKGGVFSMIYLFVLGKQTSALV